MMKNSIDYRLNVASEAQVMEHLLCCDTDFVPLLSSRVEIGSYAHKIVSAATMFEAWSGSTLVGLVAAYCNDREKKFAFITGVSVLGAWTNNGIATQLLGQCVEYVKAANIWKICLEVGEENRSAIKLYKKFGFVEGEANGAFISMSLILDSGEEYEYKA